MPVITIVENIIEENLGKGIGSIGWEEVLLRRSLEWRLGES